MQDIKGATENYLPTYTKGELVILRADLEIMKAKKETNISCEMILGKGYNMR